jgi:3-oxoacyl-[acyl-carrier-protein] synthase II
MKRVVITGLGCITPIGNDVGAFWCSLRNGRHGFAPISKFDAGGLKVSLAAEVKDFDPLPYMPASEVRKTDLYAQYALAAASQAVEQSQIGGKIAPERLGVYMGSGIGGMLTMLKEAENLFSRGPGRISPHFVPMMIGNIASALVAIKYGAQGPNLPIVTACSTSTNAIGEALHAIRYGQADAIIAGGAEATINPLAIGGFTNSMALSLSGDPARCSIPFDRERNGFVMGEGAGALLLEEYEHALKRGAKIYCEISAYGNTCDAFHVTAPAPGGEACARLIRMTLAEAGLEPGGALYINAHGTSTPLNDKTETLAIKKALGEAAGQVAVSSSKSMTGHMLGAAGAVEAIASVLALENGLLPPTVGYREPDPECDLDYVPNKARAQAITAALSISMGFGGHNAAVLFERLD